MSRVQSMKHGLDVHNALLPLYRCPQCRSQQRAMVLLVLVYNKRQGPVGQED